MIAFEYSYERVCAITLKLFFLFLSRNPFLIPVIDRNGRTSLRCTYDIKRKLFVCLQSTDIIQVAVTECIKLEGSDSESKAISREHSSHGCSDVNCKKTRYLISLKILHRRGTGGSRKLEWVNVNIWNCSLRTLVWYCCHDELTQLYEIHRSATQSQYKNISTPGRKSRVFPQWFFNASNVFAF